MNRSNDFDLDDHDNSSIGLAAFFKDEQGQGSREVFKILYEEHLPPKYKEIPQEILVKRNDLIYLCLFQIVASVLGMFYIIFRRSYIYLVINLFTFILAFCGVYGSVFMNLIYLLIHCLFTSSVTGGFFIYQIFDFFLVEDTSYGVKKRINDNLILFIFSLPYIFDFCVGVYNYLFLKSISEYNQAIQDSQKCDLEKLSKRFTAVEIQDHLLKNEHIELHLS